MVVAQRHPPPSSPQSAAAEAPSECQSDCSSEKWVHLYAEKDISKLRVIQSDKDSIGRKYAMSVGAACIAEIVTYPLDLTKTRLQLQGEVAVGDNGGSKQQYRGMFRTALGIAKEEGLLQLWRGITPALMRHVIYTGTRMTAYEYVRDSLEHENKDGFPMWKKVVAGMSAGGFGQFVASPTDLVKTQIQMEGKRRLQGKPPRVKGVMDATRQVIAQSGFFGLWRGCWPNVQRAALVNLGDLTTYDAIKSKILQVSKLEDTYVVHCLASGCAGLVGAVMGTPADVVKARIMNQPTDQFGKGLVYKNSWDCLRQTIQLEGFTGLYKGFVPCWLRMAPWSLTFWVSFEQIRKVCGAKSW